MSKYLCADCVLREQCDCEWTMRCASYVPKEYKQTNEEWIKQCNTEQLADVIADFYLLGYTQGHNETDIAPKKKWVEWLKQPHTNSK